MDNTELILTGTVAPPVLLDHLSGATPAKHPAKLTSDQINGFSEDEKKQLAKDFESVFLNKLLDEMKNTIGDWGSESDAAGEQIHGIFWLYLARHLADSGGFGMWKDIYRFLNNSENLNATPGSIDKNA